MRRPVIRADRALTAEEKTDAREALQILAGTQLTLADAARIAAGLGRRAASSIDAGTAVEVFLRDAAARRLRPSTLGNYRYHLERWATAVGAKTLDRLAVKDVEQYLASVTPSTTLHHWRAIRALLRWGSRLPEPWISVDWTAQVRVAAQRREQEVQYLPVEDCRALLASTSDVAALRATVALALFAGIRPHELASDERDRLDWSTIDRAARIIRVPAAVSKARRSRVLEHLPEALWAWLEASEPRDAGPVWSHRWRTFHDRVRKGAGYEARPWPHDALRHTFATMAVAAGHGLDQTCLWLGHQGSPAILHRHYRGLATRAEAERFWTLRP